MGRLELVVTAVAAVLTQKCNCKPDTYEMVGLPVNALRLLISFELGKWKANAFQMLQTGMVQAIGIE